VRVGVVGAWVCEAGAWEEGQKEQSWRFRVIGRAQVEQRFNGQHKGKTDSNAPPTSTPTGRLCRELKRSTSPRKKAFQKREGSDRVVWSAVCAEASQSSLEVNLACPPPLIRTYLTPSFSLPHPFTTTGLRKPSPSQRCSCSPPPLPWWPPPSPPRQSMPLSPTLAWPPPPQLVAQDARPPPLSRRPRP